MNNNLLISFLRNTKNINSISPDNYPWELLIRQARNANLLSRVAVYIKESGILKSIPEKPRYTFENSIKISRANTRSSLWEVIDTYRILHPQKIDFMLLKGSAYIWTKNNASTGRLFGDTDILIKKSTIAKAEKILVHNGWVTTKLDQYDQHFYRVWMHEIPPLHHLTRHTSLDVHHSILPPIIKSNFSIETFWEDAIQSDSHPGLYTPSLTDQILHSATHLFHEGEFQNGLRDISDLHELINQYILSENSWSFLLQRAKKLDLSAYIYYALKYCKTILHTEIPDSVIIDSEKNSQFGHLHNYFMDKLFLNALVPNHSTDKVMGSDFSRWILFIRSHWIRMPLSVLIPHLFKKSFKPH